MKTATERLLEAQEIVPGLDEVLEIYRQANMTDEQIVDHINKILNCFS